MREPQPGQQVVIVCRKYDVYDTDVMEHSAKGECDDCLAPILLARSSRHILQEYPGSVALCHHCAAERLGQEPHEFGGILPIQRAELAAEEARDRRRDGVQ